MKLTKEEPDLDAKNAILQRKKDVTKQEHLMFMDCKAYYQVATGPQTDKFNQSKFYQNPNFLS